MQLSEAKALVEAALGTPGDEWLGRTGDKYVSWSGNLKSGPELVMSRQRGKTAVWVLGCRVYRRIAVTCADDLEELIELYEEACSGQR